MTKRAYVIGMGPAGFASALTLLIRGYSVSLIDCRPQQDLFGRRQEVFLDEDTINDFFFLTQLKTKGYALEFGEHFFCKLIRPENELTMELSEEDRLDLGFFELIEKERTVIPIGELQCYQYNKLKRIYDQGQFTILGIERHDTFTIDKEAQRLNFYFDTSIDEVNAKNQELTFKVDNITQVHSFDLLIDASGKTSKSFTKLWNMQNPEFQIAYEQMKNNYTAYGVIGLLIEDPPQALIDSPVLTPIQGGSTLPMEAIDQLKSVGWCEARPPLLFLKYSVERHYVYLTGEIPEDILQTQSKEELKKWFDLLISLLFKDKPFVSAIHHLASSFHLNKEIADKHALHLPLGGVYCLIGDALLPANFLLGHGVRNALQDANCLYEMVEDNFSGSEAYHASRCQEYQTEWENLEQIIASSVAIAQLTHRPYDPAFFPREESAPLEPREESFQASTSTGPNKS